MKLLSAEYVSLIDLLILFTSVDRAYPIPIKYVEFMSNQHERSTAGMLTDADRNFDRTVPNGGRTLHDFDLNPIQFPHPGFASEMESGSVYAPEQQKLINNLFRSGCVQFGDFKLTSGRSSIYKLDLAHTQHDPGLSKMVAKEYIATIEKARIMTDIISPVPSASVPTVTLIAQELGLPMMTVRIKDELDEQGNYQVDGFYESSKDREALVADDAGTTGGSIGKAVEGLRAKGLVVRRGIVLLDREEGATENLAEMGIELISVFRAREFFEYALSARTNMNQPIANNDDLRIIQNYVDSHVR